MCLRVEVSRLRQLPPHATQLDQQPFGAHGVTRARIGGECTCGVTEWLFRMRSIAEQHVRWRVGEDTPQLGEPGGKSAR